MNFSSLGDTCLVLFSLSISINLIFSKIAVKLPNMTIKTYKIKFSRSSSGLLLKREDFLHKKNHNLSYKKALTPTFRLTKG